MSAKMPASFRMRVINVHRFWNLYTRMPMNFLFWILVWYVLPIEYVFVVSVLALVLHMHTNVGFCLKYPRTQKQQCWLSPELYTKFCRIVVFVHLRACMCLRECMFVSDSIKRRSPSHSVSYTSMTADSFDSMLSDLLKHSFLRENFWFRSSPTVRETATDR